MLWGQGKNPGKTPSSSDPSTPRIVTEPDSTRSDSAAVPQKEVPPDTRYVSPERLFIHQNYFISQAFELGEEPYWDELDTLAGYAQTLGQYGKPYRRFRDGVDDRLLLLSHWQHPILKQHNVYLQNPETQVKYYDTKTPYVNIQYMQGAQQLQSLDLTASQNLTPFWNLAAYFKRRQAVGPYAGFTTDHRTISLSSYAHTFNNRYQLFANGIYNQLNDEHHGGVNRTAAFPDLNQGFGKGQAQLNLSDAQRRQRHWAVYLDQYLQLGLDSDSVKKATKLSFRNSLLWENYQNQFTDASIDTALIRSNLISVYPTLQPDSTSIEEIYRTNRVKLLGGASFSFNKGKAFRANVNGDVNLQWMNYRKDSTSADTINQVIFEQNVKASIHSEVLGLHSSIHYRQQINNLFSADIFLESHSRFDFPFIKANAFKRIRVQNDSSLIDSLEQDLLLAQIEADSLAADSLILQKRTPLYATFTYTLHNQAPSIFQRYYTAQPENSFQPNASLNNQLLNRLALQVGWMGRKAVLRADTLPADYVYARLFLSRMSQLIYYTPNMEVRQAASGEGVSWQGVEIGLRYRFLRRLFVEAEGVYQQSSTQATGDILNYTNHLPSVYGRLSLFYDKQSVAFADDFRLGIDIYAAEAHQAHTYDPINDQFFPTNSYESPIALRADVWVGFLVKRAYIYVKMIHVNEGFPNLGYYQTPFYPMLERTFNFGVNWTFFD